MSPLHRSRWLNEADRERNRVCLCHQRLLDVVQRWVYAVLLILVCVLDDSLFIWAGHQWRTRELTPLHINTVIGLQVRNSICFSTHLLCRMCTGDRLQKNLLLASVRELLHWSNDHTKHQVTDHWYFVMLMCFQGQIDPTQRLYVLNAYWICVLM